MDVPQFEQAILKLAFETDARITTASVAYYLGLPSRRCNELLNALLAEGVLELDSDGEGNLFYRVPHKPAGSDALMGQLRKEREDPFALSNKLLTQGPTSDEAAPAAQRPVLRLGTELPSGLPLVSASDASDDSEPLRVLAQRPRSAQDFGQAQPPSDWGAAQPAPRPTPASSVAKARPPSARRSREPLAGVVARRSARPDATINACGASPLLVADSVRCDPRPIASRRPVLTQCVDADASAPHLLGARDTGPEPGATLWSTPNEQWPVPQRSRVFGDSAPNRATMLATRAGGDLALRDDMLSQPEHQPGMALLLSLILCGTGQIYNGEVSKGIMMMVLCFLLWFVLLGWVVHIWSIVDSVVVAERVNRNNG